MINLNEAPEEDAGAGIPELFKNKVTGGGLAGNLQTNAVKDDEI